MIEALGSQSIAYFRVDAMVIGVDDDLLEEHEAGGEGVTAARPNLVAAMPAEEAVGLRAGEQCRSRSTRSTSISSTRRRVRRFASAVAVAVALAAASAGAAVQATPRPPSGAALSALAQPPTRPPLASQRIYFVMPDRYANGNPANDRGGLSGSRDVTGYDPTDTGYYHGGDLAGLTGDCTGPRGLARIKDLGFTSIWVTPPYRQKYVQDGSAAYHGYWALGFDGVDPHLGTEADFRAFVDCAHALGLKVILDVVVNHTADVIRLPSYQYGPPKTPFVPPEERNVKSPAWLNDTSNYHNRGNIDFNSCPPACLRAG